MKNTLILLALILLGGVVCAEIGVGVKEVFGIDRIPVTGDAGYLNDEDLTSSYTWYWGLPPPSKNSTAYELNIYCKGGVFSFAIYTIAYNDFSGTRVYTNTATGDCPADYGWITIPFTTNYTFSTAKYYAIGIAPSSTIYMKGWTGYGDLCLDATTGNPATVACDNWYTALYAPLYFSAFGGDTGVWIKPTTVTNQSSTSLTNTVAKCIDGDFIGTQWDELLSATNDPTTYEWRVVFALNDTGAAKTMNCSAVQIFTNPDETSGDDSAPCSVGSVKICDDAQCVGESSVIGSVCSYIPGIDPSEFWNLACQFPWTAGTHMELQGGTYSNAACVNQDTGGADEMFHMNEVRVNCYEVTTTTTTTTTTISTTTTSDPACIPVNGSAWGVDMTKNCHLTSGSYNIGDVTLSGVGTLVVDGTVTMTSTSYPMYYANAKIYQGNTAKWYWS